MIALFIAAAITLYGVMPAIAQKNGPVIIRDTEMEAVIKHWAEPVIIAAGLNPAAIRFVIVKGNDVNAFVAGGQNIFIYTGLLEKTDSPDEVIGVIAHELGHIRGGHLITTQGALENASYESVLGAILGLGAAVLTGQGGFAAAVAAGSQSAALGRFLAFSRVQESSADQSGLSSLDKAGMSPRGLLSFMEKMEKDELLPADQQAAWIRTHPLARDRVEAMKAGTARSAHKDAQMPAEWIDQHKRIMAKMNAFIKPERVAWDYKTTDTSIPAQYARTVAAYRQNRVEESLRLMDGLLAQESDNPFFWELKGQMLTDFGRVEEALPAYRRAIALYPDAPLIRVALANALVETAAKDSKRLDEAITLLERAQRDEPRMGRIYRLLATAWGRKGNEPMAKLYLAEEALLNGDRDYAKKMAEAATAGFEKNSRGWLRAQDVLSFIEQREKKD